MRAPTGEQFELAGPPGTVQAGGPVRSRAIITEVAAGLRLLELGGDAVTESHPEDARPPYASGTVLVPWPNRIRDGVWQLNGTRQQLDITEVERNNAIHGLLRATGYRVADRSASAITLEATVFPQHGYPFLIDTSVRYELVGDGLVVTHTLVNRSADAAPVAVGTHPFLRVGDVPVEELTITVNAATRIVTDDRLNSIGSEPVDGTRFDLRGGRLVGDLQLDDAFDALAVDADGLSRHRITAPDGRYTELWQESDFRCVQVFITKSFPRESGAGVAIAVEPMTAPPDAFNSGTGLRWLQPGESWSINWGIRRGRG